jgi:hypothetical protein
MKTIEALRQEGYSDEQIRRHLEEGVELPHSPVALAQAEAEGIDLGALENEVVADEDSDA